MEPVAAAIRSVAPHDAPVCITGESGCGKELVAQAIHQLSGRPGPYVAVNCGGLARDLVESELFGHVRGAFSGATADQVGYFAVASRGTLLLDEVPSAPPVLQAVLLRALQTRQVTPVGARVPRKIDTRIVAATQRGLEQAVTRDGFRADLQARLEGLIFHLPPLHERIPDIGIFVAHALREQGVTETDGVTLTLDAVLALFLYHWPLNMRELATAIETARLLAGGKEIDKRHLPKAVIADEDDRLKRTLLMDLRETHGDVKETAKRLGKNRTLIYKWIKRLGIDLDELR
jgi:DNA-binding NtrC family response regulator